MAAFGEEFVVLHDWEPENPDDLRLHANETIYVVEKNDHGWWKGVSMSTGGLTQGYFPKNYVKSKAEPASAPAPEPAPAPAPAPAPVAAPAASKAAPTYDPNATTRPFSMDTIEAFDSLCEEGYAIEVQSSGGGAAVSSGMRVNLSCTAMTWDGATTEANVFCVGNLSFSVGESQVTAGLDESMVKLKVGDRAHIICGPAKGYGEAGCPPHVPPNSHVVYDVTVSSASAGSVEPASGDALLLGSGIAKRSDVLGKGKGPGNERKANTVLADPSKEVSDDMLAQAAAQMGLGK